MLLFDVKRRLRRVRPALRRFWRRVRGLWWLWLVALVLLVVGAILWAAWVISPWLLPDAQGLSPAERVAAQTAFRNTLLTILGGLAVLIGGAVAAANVVLTQRVQWQAQVTERFSRAIEQLGQRGDDKLDVRIGAIYALEQIARDSAELHWPVMEVLTAYLREHAPVTSDGNTPASDTSKKRIPADHQAIATVIGRRRREQDPDDQRLDLTETDLSHVRWPRARLEGADFGRARLEGADLRWADLERANLSMANLHGAWLSEAHLEEADVDRANLREASLGRAHLERAFMSDVHLEEALLTGAHVEGAFLADAYLEGALLTDALLKGAKLGEANLKDADLTDADLTDVDLRKVQGLTLQQLQKAAAWSGAHLPSYLSEGTAED